MKPLFGAHHITTGLSKEEVSNGWTEEALTAYRNSRDTGLVGGNVVTQFQRPKAAMRLEGAQSFNPHRWGR